MTIEFTQEQIDIFSESREEDLALWNWRRLKQNFPVFAEKYFNNDEKKGVEFLVLAQISVKKYLEGTEEHPDYNKWRAAYGEICFLVNKNNIDEDPWNKSILEERLWPPFLRIDILVGVFESSISNQESQQFYAKLETYRWD